MSLKRILYQPHGPNQSIDVHLEGWFFEGNPYHVFDSYLSALAWQSGYWEEYCDYYRNKRGKL